MSRMALRLPLSKPQEHSTAHHDPEDAATLFDTLPPSGMRLGSEKSRADESAWLDSFLQSRSTISVVCFVLGVISGVLFTLLLI